MSRLRRRGAGCGALVCGGGDQCVDCEYGGRAAPARNSCHRSGMSCASVLAHCSSWGTPSTGDGVRADLCLRAPPPRLLPAAREIAPVDGSLASALLVRRWTSSSEVAAVVCGPGGVVAARGLRVEGDCVRECLVEVASVAEGVGCWLLGQPVEVVEHDLVGHDRFDDGLAVRWWWECRERRCDFGVEPLCSRRFSSASAWRVWSLIAWARVFHRLSCVLTSGATVGQ